LSKLKSGGVRYGYVLPTQRHEQPSVLYHLVQRMLKELMKARIAAVGPANSAPRRATAVGNAAIGILLSALGITSLTGLQTAGRRVGTYAAITASLHTQAMRHGQYRSGRLTRAHLATDRHRGEVVITSDWRKYPIQDSLDSYQLRFPFQPAWSTQVYKVSTADGDFTGQTLTAAHVLRWYDQAFPGEPDEVLFTLDGVGGSDRQEYQKWLRQTFRAILPVEVPDSVIDAITPHSMRAGLVCDNNAAGIPRGDTMRQGRWASRRAFALYDRAGLATFLTTAAWIPIRIQGGRSSAPVSAGGPEFQAGTAGQRRQDQDRARRQEVAWGPGTAPQGGFGRGRDRGSNGCRGAGRARRAAR
jgi:hypothetical protein